MFQVTFIQLFIIYKTHVIGGVEKYLRGMVNAVILRRSKYELYKSSTVCEGTRDLSRVIEKHACLAVVFDMCNTFFRKKCYLTGAQLISAIIFATYTIECNPSIFKIEILSCGCAAWLKPEQAFAGTQWFGYALSHLTLSGPEKINIVCITFSFSIFITKTRLCSQQMAVKNDKKLCVCFFCSCFCGSIEYLRSTFLRKKNKTVLVH